MSTIESQRRVFDVFTRQAFFIEQIKAGESAQLDDVLRQIDAILRKELSAVKYKTLDELSKVQVRRIILAIRVSQTRVYSAYQQALLERLQSFMKATVDQTVVASASLYAHIDAAPEDDFVQLDEKQSQVVIEKAYKKNENSSLLGFLVLAGTGAAAKALWSKITNAPLPSGGALIQPYIRTAMASSIAQIENAINSGYVNKQTVSELVDSLVGNNPKSQWSQSDGSSSAIKRIRNTNAAVVETILQHIAQQSINAAASTVWASYKWVSVIDSVTSSICLERNGNVYVYGQGPLPPAHPRCRSHVIPDGGDFQMPGIMEWLKAQSADFISTVFDSTIAKKFENGTITREDLQNFRKVIPIRVNQFVSQTGLLF